MDSITMRQITLVCTYAAFMLVGLSHVLFFELRFNANDFWVNFWKVVVTFVVFGFLSEIVIPKFFLKSFQIRHGSLLALLVCALTGYVAGISLMAYILTNASSSARDDYLALFAGASSSLFGVLFARITVSHWLSQRDLKKPKMGS